MNKLLLLVNISLGTSSNQSFGEGKMEDIPTKSGEDLRKTENFWRKQYTISCFKRIY